MVNNLQIFKDNFKYMMKNWWDWEKKSFLYVAVRVPAIVLLPIVTAFVPKAIIDCITSNGTMSEMVLIVIILSSVFAGLSWIAPYLYEKIAGSAQIIRKRYIINLLEKTMNVNYSFLESFEGRERLELARKFVDGTLSASAFFINIFGRFMVNILGIMSYVVILYKIDFIIIVIICSTSIIEAITIVLLDKFKYTIIMQTKQFSVTNNYLFNKSFNVTNAKDIRIYNFKKVFLSLLNSLNKRHNNLLSKFTNQSVKANIFRGFFSFLRESVCYIYLFKLVLNNSITPSDFIFYFGIVTGLSSWFLGISEEYKNLISCCRDCQKYKEFMDTEGKENYLLEDCGSTMYKRNYNLPPEIVFENVSFKYSETSDYVLKNINLTIKPNSSIAVVGENGSGKTTLIKLLTGLYKPTKGNILIDNIAISEEKYNQCSDIISAIFQDYYIFPMTIAENVCLCQKEKIDYVKLSDCLKKAGIYDKIMSFENNIFTQLGKILFENAIELSGGETQRILLARALYRDAPIIVFDEPTAALDAIAEDNLYRNFNEISKNKTVLFISHRLSSTKFCDQIIYLSNGTIVEQGTHQELMQLKGKYFQQYMLQSYYYKEKNVGVNYDE